MCTNKIRGKYKNSSRYGIQINIFPRAVPDYELFTRIQANLLVYFPCRL
jgi:hypothetical protein